VDTKGQEILTVWCPRFRVLFLPAARPHKAPLPCRLITARRGSARQALAHGVKVSRIHFKNRSLPEVKGIMMISGVS
jgi:hypothetical protein